MPHDANGSLLAVGDEVVLPATVLSIQTGEDYCNVTIESKTPCLPGDHKTQVTLNAKQVVKQFSPSQVEQVVFDSNAA